MTWRLDKDYKDRCVTCKHCTVPLSEVEAKLKKDKAKKDTIKYDDNAPVVIPKKNYVEVESIRGVCRHNKEEWEVMQQWGCSNNWSGIESSWQGQIERIKWYNAFVKSNGVDVE